MTPTTFALAPAAYRAAHAGVAEPMLPAFAANLHRLMARLGLTVPDVVERTGLDQRTVKSILAGTGKPHGRTLTKLSTGLEVPVDELYQNPGSLVHRRFDRETNPSVTAVVQQRPELFHTWTEADFDELYSRFGEGGALTPEGVEAVAEQMTLKRELLKKAGLVLETAEAPLLRAVVELLYERVLVRE